MKLGVNLSKLDEIAGKVWRMVLGSGLSPVECVAPPLETSDLLLASVTISGAWKGILTLGCSTEVARRAAATMFGKPAESADSSDIQDALGELTNMVGGNFKTTLKGDCRLSVPKIVSNIPQAELTLEPIRQQWFRCDGGFVLLHVLKEAAAA
jgi:chemotaxis protein CheX